MTTLNERTRQTNDHFQFENFKQKPYDWIAQGYLQIYFFNWIGIPAVQCFGKKKSQSMEVSQTFDDA